MYQWVLRFFASRTKTIKALKEAEEKYQILAKFSPGGFVLTDKNGLLTYANDRWSQMTGFTFEESLGKGWANAVHPEDREGILSAWENTLEDSKPFQAEFRFLNKNGRITWVLAKAQAYFNAQGEIAGHAGTLTDISDRKRAEEAMGESEQRLTDLISTIPGMVWETLREVQYSHFKPSFVSEYGEKMLGYPSQAWLASDFLAQILHPGDRDRIAREINIMNANGMGGVLEFRVKAKDGRTVWLEAHVADFHNQAGEVSGQRGLSFDITERKEAQGMLESQMRLLEMMAVGASFQDVLTALILSMESQVEGSRWALFLMNSNNTDLRIEAAPSLPQGFKETVRGLMIAAQSGPSGAAVFRKEPILISDVSQAVEWVDCREMVSKLGIQACWSMPIISLGGQALGAFTTYLDKPGTPGTQDMKRMENACHIIRIALERRNQEETHKKNQELSEQNRRIQEANRLKSQFLANMSHELRTPLNAVIGFSEFLLDLKPGPLNEKQKEYLGDIQEGGMHLLRLINDVLDLAKIEAGKMDVFPTYFLPHEPILEVCSALKPVADKNNITIVTECTENSRTITSDLQKMKQILFNLISNAVKFSHPGGTVDVICNLDNTGHLILIVKDGGIGIRAEDMPRLFGEFQQLDSTASRRYQGTGLGLSLTRKLVELQGGSIVVESEFGKGSTFTAVLPTRIAPSN